MMAFLTKGPWLISIFSLCLQSLADIARQEAERRRVLDQQGIEAKVIESMPADGGGNLSVSSGIPSSSSPKSSQTSASARKKVSVEGIRTALQKLDQSIQQTKESLDLLRARLQSERWAIPKTGRISNRGDAEGTQTKIMREIEKLQKKLEQQLQQRAELYDRGKKAGFLPGELTGKGVVP